MKNTYGSLLKPASIGTMQLKNRVVMSPMDFKFVYGNYKDSTITKRTVEVYRARAKGGVGLIMTSHIKAEQKLDPYPKSLLFPILDRDERIKEFADLADTVHLYGSKIAGELSPGSGRYADYIEDGEVAVSASAMPTQYDSSVLTRPLTHDEIDYLVDCYGAAAGRLKAAGFDALCVHCSCGYLLGQFLSPAWNHRTDEYGGSTENRMRFLIRCIESAKKQVGDSYPIILSLTVDEKLRNIQGGTLTTGKAVSDAELDFGSDGITIEYAAEVAGILEQMGYVDAYHVRIGNYYNQEHIIPSAYSTNEEYKEAITKFRACVTKPVIFDNKLGDPQEMGELFRDGVTDFTSLGRALIAEPDWVNKAQLAPETIRPCIRCMKCLETTWMSKYSACSVNPAFGHESEHLFAAETSKRVLIVGGGPGGMQAALTAARCGHAVTLVEAADHLGGRAWEAGAVTYKREIIQYINWLIRETTESSVTVCLNLRADAAYIRSFQPDVLFVATGARPISLPLAGDAQAVLSFTDVLLDRAETGNRVAVIGGGLVGCETAYKLWQQGKTVTLIELCDDILLKTSVVYRHAAVSKLRSTDVQVLTKTKVTALTEGGLILHDGRELPADTVVLAIGLKGDQALYEQVSDDVPAIYAIGDCREARKIFEAVHEAYHLAKDL